MLNEVRRQSLEVRRWYSRDFGREENRYIFGLTDQLPEKYYYLHEHTPNCRWKGRYRGHNSIHPMYIYGLGYVYA